MGGGEEWVYQKNFGALISMLKYEICHIVQFQEISILPPMEGFLGVLPPPLPAGNSSLASYFASKIDF